MADFVYITLFLFSIAFAFVTAYLSLVLYRLTTLLKTVDKTIDDMEKKVTRLIPQFKKTIQETDKMVDDISVKLKSTDDLFETAENLGYTVEEAQDIISNSAKELSDKELRKKTRPFAQSMTWNEVLFSLYTQWKK